MEKLFILAEATAYDHNRLASLARKGKFTRFADLNLAMSELFIKNEDNRPDSFKDSFRLVSAKELCDRLNDSDVVAEWCIPVTMGEESPSKTPVRHTVVAVYGENVGLHSSRPEDLVRFLDKERIQCGNDFHNVYQAQQISYETEEEVNAFIDGVNSSKIDWNDFAIVTEAAFIPDILDMFGQKVPDSTPSNMDRLKGILRSLQSLKNSRWIPFTSPSPSSTEATVKREVNAAIEHLEKATTLNC